MHCSHNIPDKWGLELDRQFDTTFPVTPVTDEMMGHPRLLMKKNVRHQNRFPQWPQFAKYLPVRSHQSVINVVKKLDGSPVYIQSLQSPTIANLLSHF